MYKLILVDDEEEVRKGILKKIEWNHYGFEIVGEAENGREALEIAEKTMPDVVITDIKMPFMDGMELAEQLKDKFPTTKVIILTGFDEFEYAHRAIRLNVIEYVLKPISSKELIEVLIKTKERLDEEQIERKNIEALRENYINSIPLLKEKFLTTLITNTMKKEEIEERAENYKINLKGEYFVAATVSVEFQSAGMNYTEKELITFALLNIINEVIERYNLGIAFSYNWNIVIVSVIKDSNLDKVISTTTKALEEMLQYIQKYIKLNVTIGMGTFCSDISLINNSYQNSISALDYRMILGSNKIIWIEDVEPKSKDRIIFNEVKEHGLTSALKVGDEKEVIDTMENLFDEIVNTKTTIKDYNIYLMEIITAILKVAKSANINMADIVGENYNLFSEVYKFNDINDVKEWLKGISIKLSKSIFQGRYDTCRVIVDSAKNYINQYFYESDLGINDVCSHLHISPTYFSALFKRETKMTFINYLTQVRMNAAKDLLKTTGMKSFEIAEKVGYSEPNYFSYNFKKNFGISPSEFRNRN